MNSIEVVLDKCEKNISLLVMYDYSYDPGQWTLRNGDPGYQSNEEITVSKINLIDEGSNLLDILDFYNKCQDILDEIETKISEHEKSKR